MGSVRYRKENSGFGHQQIRINAYQEQQRQEYLSERRYNEFVVKEEVHSHRARDLGDYLNSLCLISLFGKK